MYAPADGLPYLKPTFGNTPCSSGAEDNAYSDEQAESTSPVDDATVNEKRTTKQSGWIDDETTAGESGGESMTPKPNPRGLLEEALGLWRENSGEENQSLPRSNFVDEMGNEDITKGESVDENVQLEAGFQAVGATRSTSNNNAGGFADPSDNMHWPHEPRYCADVWQQDDNQNDGTPTRSVWSFLLCSLYCTGRRCV